MARTRGQLVAWVQARIDELSSQPQAAVADTGVIELELDASATQLIRSVPKHLLYPISNNVDGRCILNIVSGDPYSVTMPLPATFLRFLTILLGEWHLPAGELVTQDSEEYRRQVNPYEMASIDDPIAAIVPYIDNGEISPGSLLAIEAFPPPENLDHFQRISDVPVPQPEDNVHTEWMAPPGVQVYQNKTLKSGMLAMVPLCLIVTTKTAEQMPETLHDSMVWLAAARTLVSLREPALAQSAEKNAATALGAIKTGLKGEELPAGKKA
jgi:hypothetical protein